MPENDKIQLFEEQKIRTAWDEEKEEWYFSVVDVVGVLADSKAPLAYWRKLKQRLKAEGNETVTRPTLPIPSSFFALSSRSRPRKRSLSSCGLHRSAESA